MPSVFLSHSHKDRGVARRIARDLTNQGIDVWLDEWEILVGDSITQRVQQGLHQVDFVAPLLTVHSVESGWVEKEWQSQIGLEAERKKIRVLPLKGGACEIPLLLRDKRYADLNTDYRYGMSELVRAIQGHSNRTNLYPSLTKTTARPRWQWYSYALIVLTMLGVIGLWIHRNHSTVPKQSYEFDVNRPAATFSKRSHIVMPAESYRIREVLSLSVPEYSEFELLEDRRVIDMRDWTPFNKGIAARVSPVTWSRKIRLRKIKDVEWVRFELATEGTGIDAECSSGQDYYLETGIISSTPPQVLMRAFHVVVNVAKYQIGEEFEVELLATFWNGSADHEDWTAYKVYAPVKTISIMILFPEQKVFQWKKIVMYKPESPQEQVPPDDQRGIVYTPDHQTLYWEIKEPIPNNIYEIQWRW